MLVSGTKFFFFFFKLFPLITILRINKIIMLKAMRCEVLR